MIDVDKKYDNVKLITEMDFVRRVAGEALALRAKAGIKVRQPLSMLTVKGNKNISDILLKILADEINVKKITFDSKINEDLVLDTHITSELKDEGMVRDLIRSIQEERQKQGLIQNQKIKLTLLGEEDSIISDENIELIKREVSAISCDIKIVKFNNLKNGEINSNILSFLVKKI